MIRQTFLALGSVFFIVMWCDHPTNSRAQDVGNVRKKELQKLLDFLKTKDVELHPVASDVSGSYIQSRFTVGPDHKKKHIVGLNYLPPLTLEQAKERYRNYSLPYEFHREWALFRIGGSPEYEASWKKVLAALREYPEATKPPKK